MKNYQKLALIVMISTLIGFVAVSCDNGNNGGLTTQPSETWTVTFVYGFNGITSTQTVPKSGGKAVMPTPTPVRPYNSGATVIAGLYEGSAPTHYTFLGWFEGTSETVFDFTNTTIVSNITLTAKWKEPNTTPIASVTANDLVSAVAYVNNAANPEGHYTMVIDQSFSTAGQVLSRKNTHLTIIGLGDERTITSTGNPLFHINQTGDAAVSLVLGKNITLTTGSDVSDFIKIQNGTLIMEEGARIINRNSTFQNGAGAVALTVPKATFIINGGEITNNRCPTNYIETVGGINIHTGNLIINGGTIKGNTAGTDSDTAKQRAADILLRDNGAKLTLSGSPDIGTIKVSSLS